MNAEDDNETRLAVLAATWQRTLLESIAIFSLACEDCQFVWYFATTYCSPMIVEGPLPNSRPQTIVTDITANLLQSLSWLVVPATYLMSAGVRDELHSGWAVGHWNIVTIISITSFIHSSLAHTIHTCCGRFHSCASMNSDMHRSNSIWAARFQKIVFVFVRSFFAMLCPIGSRSTFHPHPLREHRSP